MAYAKKYPVNFVEGGDDLHHTTDKFIKEVDEIYVNLNDLDTKKVSLLNGSISNPNFTSDIRFEGTTIMKTVGATTGVNAKFVSGYDIGTGNNQLVLRDGTGKMTGDITGTANMAINIPTSDVGGNIWIA